MTVPEDPDCSVHRDGTTQVALPPWLSAILLCTGERRQRDEQGYKADYVLDSV